MKVLIIDEIETGALKPLKDAGFELIFDLGQSRDYYLGIIAQFEGLILRSSQKIDAAFIDRAKKLKFIARVGAGMENIAVDYAKTKGIKCFNSPEGNRTAVGEHALAMLLMLFRKLRQADAQVRQGIWQRDENRGIELQGKTVGIVGYGNMGSAFAAVLRGFGVHLLAYDKYKTGFGDDFVQESSMEELFRQCDIVSIHTPLTEETRKMVNRDWIRNFEKNIYLINTARGPIVQTSDLVQALESGKIAGACLDVLEYESAGFREIAQGSFAEDFKRLVQMENVVLSPHIAGITKESYEKLTAVIVRKILKNFN